MARFRYPFAAALDEAVTSERLCRVRAFQAQTIVDTHEAALAELAELARRSRAELQSGGALIGSIYVEVGRRLQALAAADRERRTRLAVATRDLEAARERLAQKRARRSALERHRDLLAARHRAAAQARAAAEFDEANIARSARGGAWSSR